MNNSQEGVEAKMMIIVHTQIHLYIHTHRVCNTAHMHTACSIPNHIFTSILHALHMLHTRDTSGVWDGDRGAWG